MKQLIKYFLSFFSQHVELEQTIENLQQDLCVLQKHAAMVKYEYDWAFEQLSKKSKQLEYADNAIWNLSSELSKLQDKFFNEFCRTNQAEESMSVGEYSSKYFKKIFKNYKSKSFLISLTASFTRFFILLKVSIISFFLPSISSPA